MAAPPDSLIPTAAEPEAVVGNPEPNDSDLHITHIEGCSGGMHVPGSDVLLLAQRNPAHLLPYR